MVLRFHCSRILCPGQLFINLTLRPSRLEAVSVSVSRTEQEVQEVLETTSGTVQGGSREEIGTLNYYLILLSAH